MWGGAPTHHDDRRRSCRLETWLSILRTPGVRFYSLQKDARRAGDLFRESLQTFLKRDARTRHIPVVLVSGRDQESDRLWGKRQGADEYVTKPFSRADLVAVVGRFTAGGGAEG